MCQPVLPRCKDKRLSEVQTVIAFYKETSLFILNSRRKCSPAKLLTLFNIFAMKKNFIIVAASVMALMSCGGGENYIQRNNCWVNGMK